MIKDILNTATTESCINIIYDLYRIFHKATEGVYQTTFKDSYLSTEEADILNQILTQIDLENRIGDNNYLNTLFAELAFFEDNILANRMHIYDTPKTGKVRKLFYRRYTFSINHIVVAATLFFGLIVISIYLVINISNHRSKASLTVEYIPKFHDLAIKEIIPDTSIEESISVTKKEYYELIKKVRDQQNLLATIEPTHQKKTDIFHPGINNIPISHIDTNDAGKSLESILDGKNTVPSLGVATLKAYILDINNYGGILLRKYVKNGNFSNCSIIFNGRLVSVEQLQSNIEIHTMYGESLTATQEVDPKEGYIKIIEITAELEKRKGLFGKKVRKYPF
jgi:hypothetical protein